MVLSLYREDPEKQKNGTPIYIKDATFYVRRYGTPESNKVLRDIRKALFGPFHREQDSDNNLVLAEWLVTYGVTGWDDVLDESGKPLKFSKKAARGVFCNPEYHLSLNIELINDATRFENYLYDEAMEDIEALKKQ